MMQRTETRTTEVETMTQVDAGTNTALAEEYYHSERDEKQECGFCYKSEKGKHGEVRRVWSWEWSQYIPLCRKHAGIQSR